MLGVVLERVARLRVCEHGETVAVDDQPGDDLGKLVGAEGQLAAAARVRTNGLVVHAPDRHAEAPAGILAKLARPLPVRGVEIDVGVIGGNSAHRSPLRTTAGAGAAAVI